jgi:hypothetical protein
MPRGDRTGPEGEGPMTGWGAGDCAGDPRPGYAPFGGRAFGRRGYAGRSGSRSSGRGGGRRGWRHWFHATGLPGWVRYGPYAAPPTREQEAESLRAQAEWLQDGLDAINQRIEELGKKD